MTNDLDRIKALECRIKDLEQDRKSFFKTGILVLGAAVFGMATYIWSTHLG